MFARKLGIPLSLLGVVILSLTLGGGRAAAAPTAVAVTALPPADIQPGKPVTLGAKLVDTATNRPLGGYELQFFIMTDVFGERPMKVGQANTDATGSAYVLYKPSWEGETKVVVRYVGGVQYATGQGTYQFNAVGPVPVHQNASFGLEQIRRIAPWVIFALVGGVWAILAFVVVRTVRGIKFADVEGRPVVRPVTAMPSRTLKGN
jgi:hypothetical protein